MKKIKSVSLIFLVIIAIALFLYFYFILGNQARASRALQKGGDYVSTMYADYSVLGKTCQGEDSNSDGYVTCNFRIQKNGKDEEKTITLQCPTFVKSFLATSCKEQGIVINQQ
jgi:flagellar basal body-associated protein FliL